jgi:hypothetical protein
MVLAHPPHTETNGAKLIHLKIVRSPQRGRFILIAQLLLGKMIKLPVLAIGFSRPLPKCVSAADNFHSGRFGHFKNS